MLEKMKHRSHYPSRTLPQILATFIFRLWQLQIDCNDFQYADNAVIHVRKC